MRGRARLAGMLACFVLAHVVSGALKLERARLAPQSARPKPGVELSTLAQVLGSVSYEARKVLANVLFLRLDTYVHEGPKTWVGGVRYETGMADNLDIVPLYKLITVLDPHFLEAYSIAATHLFGALGRLDDALAVLGEGIDQNEGEPRTKELHAQRGNLLLRQKKDLAGARRALEAAIALFDRHGKAAMGPFDTYTFEIVNGTLITVCHELGDHAAVARHASRPHTLTEDQPALVALAARGGPDAPGVLVPPAPTPAHGPDDGHGHGAEHGPDDGHGHGAPPIAGGDARSAVRIADQHQRTWEEPWRLTAISEQLVWLGLADLIVLIGLMLWRWRRAAIALALVAALPRAAAAKTIEVPIWVSNNLVELFMVFVVTVAVILVLVLNHLVRRGRKAEMKDQDKLFAFAAEVLKNNPTDARVLEVAVLCCDNGLFDRALAYLQQVTGADPAVHGRADYYRVLALLGLSRLEEAAQVHDRLALDRLSPSENYRLAVAWKEHNLLSRAKSMFLKLFLTDIMFADVSLQLAEISNLEKSEAASTREAFLARLVSYRYRDLRVHREDERELICLAFDRDLGRTVRLHVLRPENADEAAVVAFLDEATRLSQLRHPAVVQVYDVQKEKLPYCSTEDFDGLELGEAAARLDEGGRLALALQLIAVTRELAGPGKPLAALPPGSLRAGPSGAVRVVRAPGAGESAQAALARGLTAVLPAVVTEPFVAAGLERVRVALSREDASFGDLVDLVGAQLESLQHYHKLTEAERGRASLMAHLRWLDDLHRSKVHSLKSKFAVCERYRDEPSKLVRTFFRPTNVDEVCRMLASLEEMIGQVHGLPPCTHPSILGLLRMLEEARLAELRVSVAGSPLGDERESPVARMRLEAMVAELTRAFESFKNLSVAISGLVERFELDLVRLVETAVEASAYGGQVKLDVLAGDGRVRVPDAAGFRREMTLALNNIISNSFEARASAVEIEIRRVESATFRILVRDDGSGVPDDLLERIRDSRFTSKDGGTSTGILAAKALVEKHRGRFEIHGRHGARGTEVSLLIPAA